MQLWQLHNVHGYVNHCYTDFIMEFTLLADGGSCLTSVSGRKIVYGESGNLLSFTSEHRVQKKICSGTDIFITSALVN